VFCPHQVPSLTHNRITDGRSLLPLINTPVLWDELTNVPELSPDEDEAVRTSVSSLMYGIVLDRLELFSSQLELSFFNNRVLVWGCEDVRLCPDSALNIPPQTELPSSILYYDRIKSIKLNVIVTKTE